MLRFRKVPERQLVTATRVKEDMLALSFCAARLRGQRMRRGAPSSRAPATLVGSARLSG